MQAKAESHAKIDLLLPTVEVQPGQHTKLGVRYTIDPDWHLYWNGQNDSGMCPTLKLTSSAPEVSLGRPQWPVPIRHAAEGGVVDHIYEGQFIILVPIDVPIGAKAGSAIDITVESKFLVCKNVCLPGEGSFTLHVPVIDSKAKATESKDAKALESAQAKLPVAVGDDLSKVPFVVAKEKDLLRIDATGTGVTSLAFYPGEGCSEVVNLVDDCISRPKGNSVPSLKIKLTPSKDQTPQSVAGIVEVKDGSGGVRYVWIDDGTIADFERRNKERVPDGGTVPEKSKTGIPVK